MLLGSCNRLQERAPDAINCKVYPMTCTEDNALDKFIDEWLAKGYTVSAVRAAQPLGLKMPISRTVTRFGLNPQPEISQIR